MLRELRNARQVAGERKRRWFLCNEIDLVVWEEDSEVISAFQLAYDKHRDEHCISWKKDEGFVHYVVYDGEPFPGVNNTPLLYADGAFECNRVLARFLDLASEVPLNIVTFVESKLREFNRPHIP